MERLNILWTTDNKDTVLHMLVMYATNSRLNGWWEEVNLIIWGASAKLASEDKEIQEAISAMMDHGISIEACKACCDRFGVTDRLTELGVNVRYMGEVLTGYIKSGDKILAI
jgi:hypothetical protein